MTVGFQDPLIAADQAEDGDRFGRGKSRVREDATLTVVVVPGSELLTGYGVAVVAEP